MTKGWHYMETVLAFSVVLTFLPMAWYFIRWFFSSADRKHGFRNRLLASIAIFFLLLIGFGNVLGSEETRIARELGFENVGEYRAAKKNNIASSEAWRKHQDDILAAELAEREKKKAEDLAAAEKAEQLAKQEEKARRANEAEAEAVRLAEQQAEDDRCRADLQCWGDIASTHGGYKCEQLIERMAKHDFEWTDGFLDLKFSHHRWRDIKAGTVTIIGDKIKMQNGFGAWTHMTYECDFNPLSEAVSDVRVSPGRL